MDDVNPTQFTDIFVVVGCGGIGYHLVEPLARYIQSDSIRGFQNAGEASHRPTKCKLLLIDGDIIEDRNTARVFSSNVIGQPKALTLANQVHKLFPDLAITVIPDYIESAKHLVKMISDARVRLGSTGTRPTDKFGRINRLHIFGCVDNIATRLIIEKAVEYLTDSLNIGSNVVYVDGGNSFDEGQAQIQLSCRRGPQGEPRGDIPEYLSTPISSRRPGGTDTSDPEDHLPTERRCTAEYTSSPQLVFANNMAAACMLSLWYATVTAAWYPTEYDSRHESYPPYYNRGTLRKMHNVASEVNQMEFSLQTATIHSSTEEPSRALSEEEFRALAANATVIS